GVRWTRKWFSPDGQRIGLSRGPSLLGEASACLYSRSGECLREFRIAPPTLYGVSFSPDLRLLASIEKGRVRVQGVAEGEADRWLDPSPRPHQLWHVYFSPDGRLLAGCGSRSGT